MIFKSEEFRKDKYKFYIALKILEDKNAYIYSNEKDFAIMQMNEKMPIWIWTKDNIDSNCVQEIIKTLTLYYDVHSKITCKKEFYDLLLKNNININEQASFEMGTLFCEKLC